MASFSGDQIKPVAASPMFPQIQQAFSGWLQGQIGKGVPAYTGTVNADTKDTILPQTSDAMSNFLKSGVSTKAGSDAISGLMPLLQNMIQYGSTGSSPQEANLAEFGVTGANNSFAKDMAQWGQSGASGDPLKRWAQITPQEAGQFLNPFASGTPPVAYQAPKIPIPGKGWV